MKTAVRRGLWATVGVLSLGVVLGPVALRGEDGPVAAPPPAASGGQLTDEMIVSAMQKGVEYLLKQKKGDNFEARDWGNLHGGETALCLYALLHVGQSLEDSRLGPRSAELAPVVDWLTKVEPKGTYVAAFQACALSLVPQKPETKVAMERARDYLMAAMDPDGGYGYDFGWQNPAGAVRWDPAGGVERANVARAKAIEELKKQLVARKATVAEANREIAQVAAKWDEQIRKLRAEAGALAQRPPMRKASKAEAMAEVEKALADCQKQLGDLQTKKAGPGFGSLPANEQAGVNYMIEQRTMGVASLKAELEELRKTSAELYSRAGFKPDGDLSNAQYALLGCWALREAGYEVTSNYWKIQERFWRLTQRADGGWPYDTAGSNRRDTMSLAGVASMFITQEFNDQELRSEPRPDLTIDRGMAWLDKHFTLGGKEYGAGNLYYMYGAERVGLATGQKFLGGHAWFHDGALAVLRNQMADGSWWGGFVQGDQTIGTAYALLFLARGRNPVIFNKLQYDGPWDARPRDNANLTAWMAKRYEKAINWQVVKVDVDASEWTDAPVLLITGSRDPKFSDKEIAKLRAYIDAGGIVFSTADAGSPGFTAAMQKLAGKVVEGKYELKALDKGDALLNIENKVALPGLLGMSNGSRLLWIHSPVDLGAAWQLRKYAAKEPFELAANLFFYATGRGSLRPRLKSLEVAGGGGALVHHVSLARVEYAGNWDPEPGAWPRMAQVAAGQYGTELKLTVRKVAELDAKATPVAHLTGTAPLAAGAIDTAKLKAYLDEGGMLLADTCGGTGGFAGSVGKLLLEMYPEGKLGTLPGGHVLYNGTMGNSAKIGEPEWRKFTLLKRGRPAGPQVQAFVVNGRTVALLSEDDITSGLLGTNTWGINGYAAETAVKLAADMVLFAENPEARKVAAGDGEPAKAN